MITHHRSTTFDNSSYRASGLLCVVYVAEQGIVAPTAAIASRAQRQRKVDAHCFQRIHAEPVRL